MHPARRHGFDFIVSAQQTQTAVIFHLFTALLFRFDIVQKFFGIKRIGAQATRNLATQECRICRKDDRIYRCKSPPHTLIMFMLASLQLFIKYSNLPVRPRYKAARGYHPPPLANIFAVQNKREFALSFHSERSSSTVLMPISQLFRKALVPCVAFDAVKAVARRPPSSTV